MLGDHVAREWPGVVAISTGRKNFSARIEALVIVLALGGLADRNHA
jgi:hypothetical protein